MIAFYVILGISTYVFLSERITDGHVIKYLQIHGFPLENADKIAHISIFCILTILYQRAFETNFYLTVLIFSLYGIGIEFAQKYFTTTREFDLVDIMADILGIFLGMYVNQSKFLNKILHVKN